LQTTAKRILQKRQKTVLILTKRRSCLPRRKKRKENVKKKPQRTLKSPSFGARSKKPRTKLNKELPLQVSSRQ
jgi:hypothetical protein